MGGGIVAQRKRGELLMTDYIATDTDLTSVANAIRTKGGTSATLEWPADFVSAIAAIPTGGGGTTPTGTISITANGTYNVTDYASADVLVALKTGVIRPDAELVQTYTYDKWMIEDEVVASLPSYSTSAQTVVASETLGTITADLTNYNYYYNVTMLAYPTYSTTSKAKGRPEWWAGTTCYELCDVSANSFTTKDGSKTYTSANRVHSSAQTCYKLLYWSSASAISIYSSGLYGVYMGVTAPSLSSSTITVKSPTFNMRGSTTYFTSTFMNAVTDIRYQYKIRVYRVKKGDLNIDGWGMTSLWDQIVDGMNNNNWTLQ